MPGIAANYREVKLIRIDGRRPVELGRFNSREEAVKVAKSLVGLGGHWSTDRTTLVAPDGARYKIVTKGNEMFKFTVNKEAHAARTVWAREARSMEHLFEAIMDLHASSAREDIASGAGMSSPPTETSRRLTVFLQEAERRLQMLGGLEPHVGPSASAWAQALGLSECQRHSDCEGLAEFNHGFSRSGSLWGVIKMLGCAAGGGAPPTTDQILDRERSGEWYPRSCK